MQTHVADASFKHNFIVNGEKKEKKHFCGRLLKVRKAVLNSLLLCGASRFIKNITKGGTNDDDDDEAT